jgi:hypothetical protein
VRESVTEQVRMQAWDAGLVAAALKQLADAIDGKCAALAEPQRLQVRGPGSAAPLASRLGGLQRQPREIALAGCLGANTAYRRTQRDLE